MAAPVKYAALSFGIKLGKQKSAKGSKMLIRIIEKMQERVKEINRETSLLFLFLFFSTRWAEAKISIELFSTVPA
jgi:hypothetical protein